MTDDTQDEGPVFRDKRRIDPETGEARQSPADAQAAAEQAAAEASERARPTTSCQASMSSETTAEPMKPVAPVTNTRMTTSFRCGVTSVTDCQ